MIAELAAFFVLGCLTGAGAMLLFVKSRLDSQLDAAQKHLEALKQIEDDDSKHQSTGSKTE